MNVPTKSVPFVKSLFPSYKRREVEITGRNSVTISDLNWSGGSRSTYTLVSLDDNRAKSLANWSTFAPWDNPYEVAKMELRPGVAVVQTGVFCGKVSLMRIYVHPSNLTPLLESAA
jgi:hypothetical protein